MNSQLAYREIHVVGAHIAVTRDVNAILAAVERAVAYTALEKADILLTQECALSGFVTDFDAGSTVAALEHSFPKPRKQRLHPNVQ